MRKLVLQRCALIFLLVSRLVVGELGHAMPMASMSSASAEMTLVAEDPAACPEHEPASNGENSAHPSAHASAQNFGDDVTDASDSHDCCKTGECECPCLHVPCAALEAAIVSQPYLELHRIPDGIQGLMLRQLSGLFRPPA